MDRRYLNADIPLGYHQTVVVLKELPSYPLSNPHLELSLYAGTPLGAGFPYALEALKSTSLQNSQEPLAPEMGLYDILYLRKDGIYTSYNASVCAQMITASSQNMVARVL